MDWFGTAMQPLAGGYSGETFVVGDGDRRWCAIYRRTPDRAVVDASLLRLVRGIVPVPSVVEVRLRPATSRLSSSRSTSTRYRSTDCSPTLPTTSTGSVSVVARSCPRPVCRAFPFLRPGGFADADLACRTHGFPTDLADFARPLP